MPLLKPEDELLDAAEPQGTENVEPATNAPFPEMMEGELRHPEEFLEDLPEELPEEVHNEPDGGTSELAELKAQIAALTEMVRTGKSEPSTTQVDDSVPTLDNITVFKDGEDAADFTLSTEGMNEFATRVVNAAVQAALQLTKPMMTKTAQEVISSHAYSKAFYTQFPDLRAHAETVLEVSAEIEAQNPSISPSELFNLVAQKSREKLGLRKPERKPGFVNPTSTVPGNNTGVRYKNVQQDIADLIKYKKGY